MPKPVKPRRPNKRKKVYTNCIRKAMNKKLKAWRKFSKCRSLANKSIFENSANNLINKIYLSDLAQEKSVTESKSPQIFFKYIKGKTSAKSKIPPLIGDNGITICQDRDKANIFNDHFCSAFVHDNGILTPLDIPSVQEHGLLLSDIISTSFSVLKKIKKLKNKCSPGFDGFNVNFIKILADVVAIPISYIFNFSMSSGTLPTPWKKSVVSPIYKKGNKNDPNNYRPISLTSIICKVMEGIIKDNIVAYFNKYKLFNDNQFGFLPRRSTNIQLLKYFNEISSQAALGLQIDSIYLDYSKAFDSIVHSKLIYKLSQYGITGNLLE